MFAQPLRASGFRGWLLQDGAAVPFLLAAHVLIWTIFAVLSKPEALHPDMAEAYAWGREFQLGYYKHPPLWAWIAALWFEIFPRTNWAFYLLAALNSALGLFGIWRLTGLFTQGPCRAAATLLLLLTPFYTFQALKYNANAALLSIWPWTLYFFVRSMEERSLKCAAMFGATAAAALLSKYYSGLLLASCFAASFLHPKWKAYYKSAAPYLAGVVCAVLIAPHVWWLVRENFPTFRYLHTRTEFPAQTVRLSFLTFALGCVGLNLGAAAMILFSKLMDKRAAQEAGDPPVRSDLVSFATVIAFGPFLLTIAMGMLGKIRLSTNFAIPIFYLTPLLLTQFLRPAPLPLLRRTAFAAVAVAGVALAIAPAIPYLTFRSKNRLAMAPLNEVAAEAARLWRERTSLPLGAVGGTGPYDLVTAFYSGDATSTYINLNPEFAPWITPALLSRTGLLAICREGDRNCTDRASALSTPKTQTFPLTAARSVGGLSAPPTRFLIYLTPPQPAQHAGLTGDAGAANQTPAAQ